jgi:hypothetical protein
MRSALADNAHAKLLKCRNVHCVPMAGALQAADRVCEIVDIYVLRDADDTAAGGSGGGNGHAHGNGWGDDVTSNATPTGMEAGMNYVGPGVL